MEGRKSTRGLISAHTDVIIIHCAGVAGVSGKIEYGLWHCGLCINVHII